MPEIAIRLYGPIPSFDPKAGPLTGLVEVEGGTSSYLVDRERERCRLDSIPGPEMNCWTSPVGVLLIARRGWWGLRALMDKLPVPFDPVVMIDFEEDVRRPYLPRDLASCPRCGSTVILQRSRKGSGCRIVTPSRRLARAAAKLLEKRGLFGFLSDSIRGRGHKAGRDHGADCYRFPLFRIFRESPPAPKKRPVGRPRREYPVKSPFPFEEARKANQARKEKVSSCE
jgi:hypothetical protein